jgi:hexulose-6-phosphate isomerase
VRFRKALKYGMIGEGDSIAAKFDVALRAGFEGVEMDSPSELDLEEVLRAKEATGIAIPGVVNSVHWHKPLNHPEARVRTEGRQGLERALLDCAAMGGTSVLLVPAVVNAQMAYQEAWERSMEAIRAVLPLVGELGVSIAIENVWNGFLLSPLEAARYVREAGTPPGRDGPMRVRPRVAGEGGGAAGGAGGRLASVLAVGFHFDPGNVLNFGEPDQWVEALGRSILKLDVKPFSRTKRDELGLWKGFDCAIGDEHDEVPWGRIRAAMARMGLGIHEPMWAAAEVGGGDLAYLTDLAARMERVLHGD